MNEKLTTYLNEVFSPYDGLKSVSELKADLLSDLQERFRELKAEGKDDETAFEMTIDTIGDIEQTAQEVANLSRSLERQVRINLSGRNLQESDFAGVTLHKGKFKASALRGADFGGADLTGSSFAASDVREANFDGANLTDCNFSTTDLADTSFRKSVLVRTNVNVSGLRRAKFIDTRLTDVELTTTDLREATFENCIFHGVDFKSSDLRGICFDGQTFIGVKFDRSALNDVSFRGATLKNVSFRLPLSVTNKSYRAFKTVCFDGATMDKLTYAALKGLWVVDLSKVTVI
ncbi:pentapeptide repeat-containing protein [Alicyclobacillus fastidiosus]|uniref:Pentapeptide repeat-containing protein n=1 Tax=Alicyclobacillus fastidiosus TaxID=392011 RepID=A0ABV5AND9_9BACL|nr:pentapeptide repeat-containing protein [Alicyclobacillus fastidiosus]WEH08232.1 pentapeptide repeat-containing protein [Alicyclobacillus fastidiosus]